MRNNDQALIRALLAKMALDPGVSERKLSAATGFTRHFVRAVKEQLQKLGLTLLEAGSMTDEAFDSAFPASSRKQDFIEPDWDSVWQFMNPQAVKSTPRQQPQISSAWEAYARRLGWDPASGVPLPEGCMSLATFTRRYHEHCRDTGKPDRSTAPSLRFRRGELMEIDTIGDRFRFMTPDRALHSVKLFTAVLKYSGLVFAEATARTATSDWVRCTADAFRFIGGVPQAVRSDNDPAIVIIGRKDGVRRLQPSYEALLRAYGAAYDLAPVRAPTCKGAVERANGLLVQELFSQREGGVVEAESLDDYNRQLLAEVERINLRIGRNGASRRSVFEACERGSLMPLPDPIPQPREIRLCKAGADGYVRYGGHYYFAGSANRCSQIIAEEVGGRRLVLSAGLTLASARRIASCDLCLDSTQRPLRFKAGNLLSAEERAVRRGKAWFAAALPEGLANVRAVLDALWGKDELGNPLAAKRSSALARLARKAADAGPQGPGLLDLACGKALAQKRASDLTYVESLLALLLKLAAEGISPAAIGQEPGAHEPDGEGKSSDSDSFTRGAKYYGKFYSKH